MRPLPTSWVKLLRDAQAAQGRLVVIVIALAAGTVALASLAVAWAVLTREVPANYRGIHPASAQLDLQAQPGAQALAWVRAQPGIAAAELSGQVLARIEVAPGEWLPLLLFVRPDMAAARIHRLHAEAGAWPPPADGLVIERSALSLTNKNLGQSAKVVLPQGGARSLPLVATVHDPSLAPAWQEQTVYGYISPAALAALGEPVALNLLNLEVQPGGDDAALIERVASAVATGLAAQGVATHELRIPPPGRHPHQGQMNAVLQMLLVFGLLALVLGAVLTASVVDAWLAQQVRQIAIMKALGARSVQIAQMVMAMVGLLGLAAVVVGWPLGWLAGQGLVRITAQLLNLRITSQALPALVPLGVVGLGLGLPLLAAWWPVRRATARTVRAAMHDHGVRVAAPALPWRLPGVALNLAWRYAFRQRGRWLMTTALLAGAGAMAITCLNLRAAWQDTVARSALDRHYQVEWFLQAPAPQAALLAAARALPGVVQAEAWGAARGALEPAQGLLVQRSYPDGAHGGFAMRAAPPDTRLIDHTMAEGRWLQAGDVQGLVVNTLARNGAFRGVALGQWVQLRVGHRSLRLQLQGVVRELLTPGAAYVLPGTLAQAVEAGEGSNALRVALADPAQAEVVAQAGVLALQRQGWATRLVITEQRLAAAQGGHVFILVGALGFIAVLMAVVGLLGLASALGTAVVERSRELAVMRALGARGATLMQSLLIEGVLTGGISWLLALVLAWPLSASVGQVLAAISAQPLVLRLSPGGAALWLACVLLGAALVSWWPATQAARLTVRQALSIT